MTTLSIPVPWYRQRWPWLLFAGPAIVVVASFATLWLAASSDDGVIAPRPAGRWLVSVETDLWKLPATPAPDGLAEVHLGAARSAD